MKITIRKGVDCTTIRIPNGLLFNPVSGLLMQSAVKKYAPEAVENLDFHRCQKLFAELRRVKKRYGSWTLVEVQSADGEAVTVSL